MKVNSLSGNLPYIKWVSLLNSLDILDSNASSSSTKVFKCLYIKKDSIFIHNGLQILRFGINLNAHTHKDEHDE